MEIFDKTKEDLGEPQSRFHISEKMMGFQLHVKKTVLTVNADQGQSTLPLELCPMLPEVLKNTSDSLERNC